jgi:DnaJ-domain-containing protein 1
MGWKGKVIGGSIGFVIGGPVGAAAGAAVGHSFDLEEEKQTRSQTRRRTTGQLQKRSRVPYEILKCTPEDSDDEIKRQYRRLVQEYHPDRIASLDLPPEFNQLAHDKFREITRAYEMIKKERGLS